MDKEQVIKGIKERLYSTCELRPSEVLVLKEYIEDLENNWNELKSRTQKKIEQLEYYNEQLITSPYTPQIETLKLTLKDMQELEGNNE